MPLVNIDLDSELARSSADQITTAIRQAHADALGIGVEETVVVFAPYDDGHERVRFNSSFDGRGGQLVISLILIHSYSVATKLELYRQILLRLGALGIHPEDVHIPVVENAFEDWHNEAA